MARGTIWCARCPSRESSRVTSRSQPAVLAALRATGYDRLVSLELSRDGHRAHQMVPRSIELLREAEG